MVLLFPMIDDQQHRSVLLVLRGAAHSENPLGEGQDPVGWSRIHLELARNTPLPPHQSESPQSSKNGFVGCQALGPIYRRGSAGVTSDQTLGPL